VDIVQCMQAREVPSINLINELAVTNPVTVKVRVLPGCQVPRTHLIHESSMD
jgi:hypothetical protein